MADPRVKNIKIKTGVLKRLTKEKLMYEKEVITEGEKVERFKAGGKDEYEIRKQIEVLEESKMMVPDCTRRIKAAYGDLKNLLDQEEELKETEEYKVAAALLIEHQGAGDQ
ncbi:tubulin-specific chaperone A-like [Strongylocentrotus purpuratus]|jgi:tubulin-specific chaperone A|uniref:Tubulin-specific chaperone A n=1 Tax=Strongylocentrotus purpuratus TaxID=7668 RepID=A0A7M7N7A7_STRPU|nr:tubulin-specific chaperone A-like [Strongylocentrotus purpuratus]|eukprot:XP_011672078.1 PREDICTED: tubulin-specific chaperone A-like isoform X2 [Strongylocentrotus purpuratus]